MLLQDTEHQASPDERPRGQRLFCTTSQRSPSYLQPRLETAVSIMSDDTALFAAVRTIPEC